MKKINSELQDGIRTDTYYDPDDDRLTIKREQDVEPYLERNKKAYNENAGFKDELTEVAFIPNIIVEQWFREGFNIFDPSPEARKKLKEKLNDPQYRYLRTRPGKI